MEFLSKQAELSFPSCKWVPNIYFFLLFPIWLSLVQSWDLHWSLIFIHVIMFFTFLVCFRVVVFLSTKGSLLIKRSSSFEVRIQSILTFLTYFACFWFWFLFKMLGWCLCLYENELSVVWYGFLGLHVWASEKPIALAQMSNPHLRKNSRKLT